MGKKKAGLQLDRPAVKDKTYAAFSKMSQSTLIDYSSKDQKESIQCRKTKSSLATQYYDYEC